MKLLKKWIKSEPTEKDIENFLNGATFGKFHAYHAKMDGDTRCHFKKVRFSTRFFNKSINARFVLQKNGNLSIRFLNNGKVNYIHAESRNSVYNILRSAYHNFCFHDLVSNYANQGKKVACTAVDRANNSFVRDGKFISFSGFKFIHKACLNLLPVNSAPGRNRNSQEARCRQCGYPNETLAHIICHCKPHLGVEITDRHNAILKRVVKTIEFSNKNSKISVNSVCNVANRNVRPDIVVINETDKSVDILDVTCPFENGTRALVQARLRKQLAYEPEVRAYQKLGYRVFADAIVVGALGTWDRHNDRILMHMGTSWKYLNLMKKFIIRETIDFSKNLFWKHILSVKYQ